MIKLLRSIFKKRANVEMFDMPYYELKHAPRKGASVVFVYGDDGAPVKAYVDGDEVETVEKTHKYTVWRG